MSGLELVLVVSVVVCVYAYVGYPLLLGALAVVRRRGVRRGEITPSVSVIIPAHNEARDIGEKLESVLRLDYPTDRLELLVASDGSTDATEAIVGQYEAQGVCLLRLPRCGKPMAINQAAARARGEILVFTDANALLDPQALRHLVRSFADPEVGGVSGVQRYRSGGPGDSAGAGESLYWAYDTWVKHLESRQGSIYAADGSLYAIRRDLYVPVRDPAEADDIAISARVPLQGHRLVFEPEAVAYEPLPVSCEREFRRKVRVASQTWRTLFRLVPALNPRRDGFYALALVSHNVMRYLVPFCMLIALTASAVLTRMGGVYELLLLGQVLFYGAALAGYILRRSRWGRVSVLGGAFYFCLANAAVLLGALRTLTGRRTVGWQPDRAV